MARVPPNGAIYLQEARQFLGTFSNPCKIRVLRGEELAFQQILLRNFGAICTYHHRRFVQFASLRIAEMQCR
jgi:hypothetical protein